MSEPPSEPLALDTLLARLTSALAHELAPRLAAELATDSRATGEQAPASSRLLSLDELVERLPKGKAPATWKRWLYERTRRGQVPGCHKLGGRLFFDPAEVEAWLAAGTRGPEPAPPRSTG